MTHKASSSRISARHLAPSSQEGGCISVQQLPHYCSVEHSGQCLCKCALCAPFSIWLADNLLDEQCGVRPNKSTTDAQSLPSMQWGRGQRQSLYICMLDLTKAFDSVDRGMAWQILLRRSAPPKLVALIKDLHTQHSAIICREVGPPLPPPPPVKTNVGFKQGCVLAPPLFNICLDTVGRQLLPCLQQLGVIICFKIDGQLRHCKNPTWEELM